MNTSSRQVWAAAGLALTISPILFTEPAAADTLSTKARIEYAERQAGKENPSKAQIEHREREQLGGSGTTQQVPGPTRKDSGDNGPAAWQLALGAALGVGLAGGATVAVRQASHHHPVASAH